KEAGNLRWQTFVQLTVPGRFAPRPNCRSPSRARSAAEEAAHTSASSAALRARLGQQLQNATGSQSPAPGRLFACPPPAGRLFGVGPIGRPGGPAMLRVLGEPRSACDGLTRRDLLRVGALTLFGGLLPQPLRGQEPSPPVSSGRARSVILLDLFG